MEQKTIGKFITALRKANGMTQKELAEKLNVSDKTVSRWERDEGTPIAMGISVVGMIVALIGNLAFLKAVLGFLLGAIFLAASIVCQAVFMNRAFLSVEDAGLEWMDHSQFKHKVIRMAQKSFGLTVAFLGFTFPLVLMDAYVGLSADNMLIFGMGGAAVFLLAYALVLYFVNASLLKKEVYYLSEKESVIYHHNHRLIGKCAGILAIMLVITCFFHQAATTIYGPWSIMDGTEFHDYESFVAFMEQDIPYQPNESFLGGTSAIEQVAPQEEALGEPTYYDQYGNVISEEEALHRTLEDKNGNVVCEYIDRNESVVSLRYSAKDGTVLPITVCTADDLEAAREKAAVRNVLFIGIYALECIVVAFVYLKKRKK